MRWRRFLNATAVILAWAASAVVLLPLLLVLAFLVRSGLSALNGDFFTHLPGPAGEPGGGMANAIVGTLMLLVLASLLGVPLGILGGVYAAEFPATPLARTTRFLADVLGGVPSIVVGVFAYVVVVLPMRHFSALAGGFALAVMLIPVVLRTTEEVVRLVPRSIREAALALGVPWWRTIVGVVIPTAARGIVTGVMVGVARIAGETAPLLFTAFGNRFWSWSPTQPVAALPLQIYAYAISPFPDWHRQAWAGALVLVALVLALNVTAHALAGGRAESP
jgi:phosphate transport system permease protein